MVEIFDATGVVQVGRGALIMDTCPILAGSVPGLVSGVDAEFNLNTLGNIVLLALGARLFNDDCVAAPRLAGC
jgi:hypothetical protein